MDLSWKSLLAMPSPLISFCIQSTFDTPPSPSNLARWKISPDSLCSLCKSPSATVSHVLSGCKVALDQGRYTYRHDNILSGIVKAIQDFLCSYSPFIFDDKTISFVKAGSKGSAQPKTINGILHKAEDWKLSFDSVDQELVIPLSRRDKNAVKCLS